MILDLDPPDDDDFSAVVAVAHLVQQALSDSGLAGAVKTSGAKGLHVFVPIDDAPVDDVAAATRALAARAEALDPSIATTAFIVADRGGKVFVDSTRTGGVERPSPRRTAHDYARIHRCPFHLTGPISTRISPADFTVHTALDALDRRVSWADSMPAPQRVPSDLIEQGRTIPVARVTATHEGKRRARRADES